MDGERPSPVRTDPLSVAEGVVVRGGTTPGSQSADVGPVVTSALGSGGIPGVFLVQPIVNELVELF